MTKKDADMDHAKFLDILKTTYLFKDKFSDDLLLSLINKAGEIDLPKDEYLFRQGDSGDEMYIVLSGLLRASIRTDNGPEVCVAKIGPGSPVGEIQFLTGGKRTAGIFAEEDARILSFSKESFDPIIDNNPDFFEKLNRIILDRLKENQLLAILPELFGRIDENTLEFIKQQVKWVLLKKGERLFHQGERDDSFFVLISGRLSVSVEDQLGSEQKVGTIRPGESVGEMGMITGESRTASVFAVRDSQLVKIEKSVFERIIEQFPRITMDFMKILVERSKKMHASGHKKNMEMNFAILPAHADVPLTAFVRRLDKALSKLGRVLHLSSERLDHDWAMPDMSQTSVGNPKYIRLSAWLDEQEVKYNFILYETDPDASNWTGRCLQQADHILVVGTAGADPGLKEIEKNLYSNTDHLTRPQISLILIHPDGSKLPEGTCHWLAARQLDFHHHVRWDTDRDFDRIARFITGNAVGLVLGGGGARGLAHLGLMKALEEFDIPVDMVCGTSIGSIMGGICAMGWDHKTRMQTARKCFVDINPVGDYTFPVIALVKSKILDQYLQLSFGETRIEDLWLNYFCVSSNLTTSKLVVHDSGPLWQASRASIALPGILMPVVDQNNLLVDGGVINNLPADIMRQRFGGFIMVANVSPEEDLKMPHAYNKMPSAGSFLWSRISPFNEKIVVPTILDILMRTILLSSINQSDRIRDEADHYFNPPIDRFGLLDFKALDDIVAVGYDYAIQELHDWKLLSEELWEFKLSGCLYE